MLTVAVDQRQRMFATALVLAGLICAQMNHTISRSRQPVAHIATHLIDQQKPSRAITTRSNVELGHSEKGA
ncbi:hypothetical protein C2W62_12205 [Candidatus Entotheonella serta]|nr:hypothetical protein C2W62_12205 [Candidatus Entotheonella serta]